MKRNVIMFAGKGGVGKTTCAAATALNLALNSKKTLIISTDPTPSLGHIFETGKCTNLLQVLDLLYVHEIGINNVQEMWDKKFGKEVYDVFSSFVDIDYDTFTEFIISILPGMRDEFIVDYIRELSDKGDYEVIVWDTAPLGQTLGLLKIPSLLSKHLRSAPRIYSRIKFGTDSKRSIMRILRNWEILSKQDMDFIHERVSFRVVTIPESLAYEQLEEIMSEFNKNRFFIEKLIINNVLVFNTHESTDLFKKKAEQQKKYINILHDKYTNLEVVQVPMYDDELKGLKNLNIFRRELPV